jgi:hypothetical protein
MALEQINVGGTVNDGTGDDLRDAFIKININFQELDGAFLGAASLGTAGAEVYAGVTDSTANFRRLVAGNNIELTQLDNSITIATTIDNSRYTISGDSGSVIAGNGIPLNIVGSNGVIVLADENSKTITVQGGIDQLQGELDANGQDITDVGTITVDNIVPENINSVDYNSRLGTYIEGFDFGPLSNQSYSILDWTIRQVDVDFGTFDAPAQGVVDLGNILV